MPGAGAQLAVILYDHPRIAAESAGELFDSTEIDEILTLRTLALTDEEKREARATDPRAAALLDRLDDLPPRCWSACTAPSATSDRPRRRRRDGRARATR
jgi:hypothetical protein